MNPTRFPTLPPATISDDGTSRFYGFAPDPATSRSRRSWKHRISVHERNRATGFRSDAVLDVWFDTFEEAEAFTARLNTMVETPAKYRVAR
jgi:hypothetical protein